MAFTGLDKEAIRALNPQYRTDVIPGSVGPMSLCLPTEALTALIDQGDSIFNYRSDDLLTRRATVAVPETQASSRRSSASASSSRSSKQATKSKSSRSERKSRKQKSQPTKTATVRKGETLSEIAARNGTSVKKLRQLNGIKGDRINIGQKLRVK